MRRVLRTGLLLAGLVIAAILMWLSLTPDGRETADDLQERWQEWRHGDEARQACEQLAAMKVKLVRSPPPDNYFVGIDCQDQSLGDEGFRLVGKCFHVKTASFVRTDLNDDRMKYVAQLTHLTSLTILDTPAVTDDGIQRIASLNRLVGLLLRGTAIGDRGLKQIGRCSELATLDLSRTQVTDAGMPALAGLAKLQWLVLAETAVGDEGVMKLRGLTALKQISLQNTKVTPRGRAWLSETYPGLKIE